MLMPDHDLYRQFHEEIAKRQLSNNEAFDKAILSLSSAGLGLSLTFFKFVVPAQSAVSIWTLKFSWFLFLISIIATILSFVTSQRALSIELKHAEKYYLEDNEAYENKSNPASTLTETLNIFSGLSFIAALVFIVLFVTKNI